MARKQEGRWTNVSKSVYSLVLSDDVVAAVDRAAYGPVSYTHLDVYKRQVQAQTATVGDIVCISGIENLTIGQTICAPQAVEPLEFVKISAPTVEMTFSVNNSPFAGKEGKFLTSRHLRDRLFKETLKDVSLHVYETDSTESFRVAAVSYTHLDVYKRQELGSHGNTLEQVLTTAQLAGDAIGNYLAQECMAE